MLAVELHPYGLGLRAPLTTARATLRERRGVLVRVAEESLAGWGEAAPMPGWSPAGLSGVIEQLETAGPVLADAADVDDHRVEQVLADLVDQPDARAAIAGAVFDLRARRAGVALADLLAPGAATSVGVHGLVAARDPDDAAAAAQRLVEDGFAALKLKVGEAPVDVDLARVAAVRAASGPDIELRLDANGGWDVDTAVDALAAMSAYDIAFCEEPVEGLDGLAAVGRSTGVPIAVDESARSLDDIAVALDTGEIDVVVVKPQAIGGPDIARRAVVLARERGATPVVTTMIDSAVGVAHAAHVAAACGPHGVHGLATAQLLADDVADPPRLVAGRLDLPAGPGLGLTPRFAV